HGGGVVERLVGEELPGRGGVEAHAVRALGDFRRGLRDGLAHLQRHQPGQRDGGGLDDVGRGVHPDRAVREGGGGPAGGGGGGLGDPAFDLGGVVRLERPHGPARGGIDGCDRHRCLPRSVEDDDLAAHHVTASQGVQVLVDLVELDFGDVVLDAAGFGEGEHFYEVQVVAPEGTEVGQLRAYEGELSVLDALAHEADCCQCAFGAQ